jgi:hypothetical protein
LFQKWFPLEGTEPREKKTGMTIGRQEKKGKFNGEVHKK